MDIVQRTGDTAPAHKSILLLLSTAFLHYQKNLRMPQHACTQKIYARRPIISSGRLPSQIYNTHFINQGAVATSIA